MVTDHLEVDGRCVMVLGLKQGPHVGQDNCPPTQLHADLYRDSLKMGTLRLRKVIWPR